MVGHKIMYRFIDHGSHLYLSLSIQLFQRLCHNWRQVPAPNKAVTCVLQINIAFCPNQLNYIELRRFTSTQWTLVKCPHFLTYFYVVLLTLIVFSTKPESSFISASSRAISSSFGAQMDFSSSYFTTICACSLFNNSNFVTRFSLLLDS